MIQEVYILPCKIMIQEVYILPCKIRWVKHWGKLILATVNNMETNFPFPPSLPPFPPPLPTHPGWAAWVGGVRMTRQVSLKVGIYVQCRYLYLILYLCIYILIYLFNHIFLLIYFMWLSNEIYESTWLIASVGENRSKRGEMATSGSFLLPPPPTFLHYV